MTDQELMERTFQSLGAIQEYMASIQTTVGRMDERLKGIESTNKRHSGDFAKIERNVMEVDETAERRVNEVWSALDDRLSDLREDQKEFFRGIASNDAEIKKRLEVVEKAQFENAINRRWTVIIASAVSSVVSGVFVAIASAVILR